MTNSILAVAGSAVTYMSCVKNKDTLDTLTSYHVYDGDRLVQADRQICGVLFTQRQLKEEWRLIDVADLLVDVDIQHGGLVAGTVPAEDVHVGEDLLEMLLIL